MTKITKRQKEVLILTGKGLTNQEIAEKLMITEHTVKSHLNTLYKIFGCNSKTVLVVKALKENFISLKDFNHNTVCD